MYRANRIETDDKAVFYRTVTHLLEGLLAGETDGTANLANAAALLGHQMKDINWVGFYLLKGDELLLGPFQGKPACTRIPVGRGVCGTAAAKRSTEVVPDVHIYPGHITCDGASASEIVVPIFSGDRLAGVLDIDSPLPGRFDAEDAKGLEAFVETLAASLYNR
jgi:GAF domain-containing protein